MYSLLFISDSRRTHPGVIAGVVVIVVILAVAAMVVIVLGVPRLYRRLYRGKSQPQIPTSSDLYHP